MAETADRQELLTALTTEHFTLQGARAQTVSESTARAALYIMAVSSTLIALGFIAQATEAGDLFNVFAVVVLPTLYLMGIFTFMRLAESGDEDLLYGRAINRIRHYYYLELAGDQARLFMLSGHDDWVGVLRNMALQPTRTQPYLTAAYMIAIVNSIIGAARSLSRSRRQAIRRSGSRWRRAWWWRSPRRSSCTSPRWPASAVAAGTPRCSFRRPTAATHKRSSRDSGPRLRLASLIA